MEGMEGNIIGNSAKNALIVGASGGIGLEFARQILQDLSYGRVFATYRRSESAIALFKLRSQFSDKLYCLPMDITEESQIEQVIRAIAAQIRCLHLAVNCIGILQEGELKPEKSLKQLNSEHLLRYFQVNSIGTALLAKHLLPLFKHDEVSIFAAISAKVGSIGDNRLGGWYGYRASKAALNMFVKNVAIEYGRVVPKAIAVALHPGTTDTQLSRPFQRNVPPEKLFSPERTVRQLLAIVNNLTPDQSGQFFSWDGSPLPW
jgi:NAD(P)-dependent dehydrogenase (short-subunit alcohol dehydrogenase family)